MRLPAGTRLGSFEILSALGAGGMGEVYRARDTRLGRDVAIKILPAAFTADVERLARFQREARVLASLNHPNIAAIYGIEEGPDENGSRGSALVLELIEGETLANRIQGGRIPLVEALAIAAQVADAIDAAHEKGIVHRDLKPTNIQIALGGTVKVLDFGLAKFAAEGGPLGDPAQSPTMSATPTRPGMLLGTAAYMSPEQARGRDVDKRADVWAFGCVLYEMLTGRSAFGRETASDTIAAILEREPDWEKLPASTPVHIRQLIRRCLDKDLRRRLRDIGDAHAELTATVPTTPMSGQPRPGALVVPRLVWMAGAPLLAMALAATFWIAGRPARTASSNVQLQRITDLVGMEESPAISPDGRSVAFVAGSGAGRHIWIRLVSGGVPLQVTRDAGEHRQPRWAPDSTTLIYYSPEGEPGQGGAIWEVSALGGSPRRITAAMSGGDISHDGTRIAFFQYRDGRPELRVAARDGSGAILVSALSREAGYESPRWAPDDRWIAFQSIDSVEFDKRLYVVAAVGGDPRRLARGDDLRGLAWVQDGTGLVYASSAGSTVLYPPTFNLRTVRLDGTGDRQLTFGDVSYVEPDMRGDGRLVAGRVRVVSDIWKIPVTGSPIENTRAAVRITRQTGAAQTPSVSPDETEIVYLSDSGGHGNLWVVKADGSETRQLTFERDPMVSVGVPVWSSAGNEMAFILTRSGAAGQWLVNRDGSGLRQFLPRATWAYWSGDGQWLYYTATRGSSSCIEKAPLGGGATVPVRCDDARAPAVSRDGSTLYFVTPLKSGASVWDWEIRKATPEDGPSRVLARVAGARVPVDYLNIHTILSPDDRRLALPLSDGVTSNLWALTVEGGPLRPLTDFGDKGVVIARRVSWSRDGRFIYAAVAETEADIVLLTGLWSQ